MMKNIIEKIKLFLSEEEPVINLETVKTSDGLILTYEMLEVGQPIFTIETDGTQTVTPDGSYTIEDQTVIEVKDGLIDVITLPVETPETPEVETPEVEIPVVEIEGKTDLSEITSRLEKLESENILLQEMLVKLAESIQTVNFTEELKDEKVKLNKEKINVKHETIPEFKENINSLNSVFRNMYK